MIRNTFKYLIFLICVIMLTTACQPTPEKEIIIGKNDGGLEEKIFATPIPTGHNANGISETDDDKIKWEETTGVNSENPELVRSVTITVNVNAEKDAQPNMIPVVSIRPDTFSLEFAENAAQFFFHNEYYDGTRTKPDYLTEMTVIKQAMQNSELPEYQKENLKEYFKYAEECYSAAPENNKPGSIKYVQTKYGEEILLKSYPGNNCISEMLVGNSSKSNTLFYYIIDNFKYDYLELGLRYNGIPARGMKFSYDDAKDLAQSAVRRLCPNDFQFQYAELAKKMSLYEEDSIIKDSDQAYVFYFTRCYEGIGTLHTEMASFTGTDDPPEEEYIEPWPREVVKVTVDDTGINRFFWICPSIVIKTVNSNVATLPFEEIFEIFKKHIFYSSLWADWYTKDIIIDIEKVEFGMVRIQSQDDLNTYIMVPAWNFVGHKTHTYTGPDEESIATSNITDSATKSFMCINAIDGSIIDITKQ